MVTATSRHNKETQREEPSIGGVPEAEGKRSEAEDSCTEMLSGKCYAFIKSDGVS